MWLKTPFHSIHKAKQVFFFHLKHTIWYGFRIGRILQNQSVEWRFGFSRVENVKRRRRRNLVHRETDRQRPTWWLEDEERWVTNFRCHKDMWGARCVHTDPLSVSSTQISTWVLPLNAAESESGSFNDCDFSNKKVISHNFLLLSPEDFRFYLRGWGRS